VPVSGGFYYVLAIDFNGAVFQHRFSLKEVGSKIMLCSLFVVPEHLKGRNKTSFCIAHFPTTNILLLSFKSGSSFLCSYFENEKLQQLQTKQIFVLDNALTKLKLEGLLCAPRLLSVAP
jgi:hypothetical protein